jgi:hypothetical protein
VLPLKESSEQVPAVEIEAAMGQLSDAEFKKRVLDAFIFARQYFVAEANVEAVFHAINAWDNGGRGYMVSSWSWYF